RCQRVDTMEITQQVRRHIFLTGFLASYTNTLFIIRDVGEELPSNLATHKTHKGGYLLEDAACALRRSWHICYAVLQPSLKAEDKPVYSHEKALQALANGVSVDYQSTLRVVTVEGDRAPRLPPRVTQKPPGYIRNESGGLFTS
ncbi:hypothetical protein QJQ45_024078, partial [Haematococcus lacustris]